MFFEVLHVMNNNTVHDTLYLYNNTPYITLIASKIAIHKMKTGGKHKRNCLKS